jgi:mannose-6-phosphate isomerase-like protein (cupin superfamily)
MPTDPASRPGEPPGPAVPSFAPVALAAIEQFVTADGSLIRELSRSERQTLAEATLLVGGETQEHYHPESQEIYQFLSGTGRMRLGEAEAVVNHGDCVLIPPGAVHKLWNTGEEPLVLLCCCVPPYSDDDTVLTGR